MANRHCGRFGCVLSPHHVKLGNYCVNAAGYRILDHVGGFYQPKAEKFRDEVVGAIHGSINTEFSALERDSLRRVVEGAARKDPYILRHVWDQIHKQLRDTADDKALFLTTCLQYHGLDVTR